MRLRNVDDQGFLQQESYIRDGQRFAAFSQLARLLSAEDVIVRWNVKGMDCPARMNYATRVLDVAPIKEEHENLIPGLILHEVGHFIFSARVDKQVDDRHGVDVERLNDFKSRIKNHHIWNIIEDGYIERRLVAKWPGALKHLRALFDFEHGHVKYDDAFYAGFSSLDAKRQAVEVVNLLHTNALGSKFGIKHAYPREISTRLRALLEAAVVCAGTDNERAELSSKIVTALNDEFNPRPKKASAPKPAPKQDKPRPTVVLTIAGAESDNKEGRRKAKPIKLSTANVAANDHAEELQQEAKLESALAADVIAASVEPSVEPSGQEEPAAPVLPATEERQAEVDSDKQRKLDALNGEGATEQVAIEESAEAGMARLEEFISDAKALLIGQNASYLDAIMQPANPIKAELHDLFIPSPEQVLLGSSIKDLLSDQLKLKLETTSFFSFLGTFSASELNDIKRLPGVFNRKLTKSRAAAQQLFQRFNAKANALNVALTTRRRVGSLDPTRAALFQIYDDVFKRRTLAPNQVNHAYVLMVDWSSSMTDTAMELFHRVTELTFFAQLAKVELDVWLYTTDSESELQIAERHPDRFPTGTLLTSSKFVNVLNTKRDVGDKLMFRLFALFMNAVRVKQPHRYIDQYARPAERLLGLNFVRESTHHMSGTNIFEAISFAQSRVEKLNADRRCIMLMTDGVDGGFGRPVCTRDENEVLTVGPKRVLRNINTLNVKSELDQAPRIMFNGNNLVDTMRRARERALGEKAATDERYYGVFQSVRSTATTLLADYIRQLGISVVGVSWDSGIPPEMVCWARGNVIRVQVPLSEKKSRSLTTYATVKNEFITHITEALLSNIKPTTANP